MYKRLRMVVFHWLVVGCNDVMKGVVFKVAHFSYLIYILGCVSSI